jgi:hypothetical protein
MHTTGETALLPDYATWTKPPGGLVQTRLPEKSVAIRLADVWLCDFLGFSLSQLPRTGLLARFTRTAPYE